MYVGQEDWPTHGLQPPAIERAEVIAETVPDRVAHLVRDVEGDTRRR